MNKGSIRIDPVTTPCTVQIIFYERTKNSKPVKGYGATVSSPTCSYLVPNVPSALNGGEPPIALSFFLLVSGLDETKHDFCQCQASSFPHPQTAVCYNTGSLAAHGADEKGADFSLRLAHLQRQQVINDHKHVVGPLHSFVLRNSVVSPLDVALGFISTY